MTLTRSPTSVRILEHIATNAISGRRALLSMAGSERTTYNKLTQLRSEGYILKSFYLGENLYVLSPKGKESLADSRILGERSAIYKEHLRNGMQRVNTADISRTKRQQRQGEIITAMENASVRSFVGNKPLLGVDGTSLMPDGKVCRHALTGYGKTYYTSTELRNALGASSKFAASARLFGVLAGDGEVFGVYHTGDKAISASFNKEVLAYEEFCLALSRNGYIPRKDSMTLREDAEEIERLNDVELINRTSEEYDEGFEDSEADVAEPSEAAYEDFERDEYGYAIIREDSEAALSAEAQRSAATISPISEAKSAKPSVSEISKGISGAAKPAQPATAKPLDHKDDNDGGKNGEISVASEASEARDSRDNEAARRAQQKQRIAELNYTAANSAAVRYSSEAALDRLAKWLGHYYVDSIVFGDGFEAAREMIEKTRQKYSVLKPAPDTFRSMAYIPVDDKTAYHLRLITTPNWREMMSRIIFKSKPETDEESGCDGKVGDELWYNFCDLDLIRIRELLDYLEERCRWNDYPQVVIWAQSQHEDFLRSLFDKYGVQYKLTQIEKLMGVISQVAQKSAGGNDDDD